MLINAGRARAFRAPGFPPCNWALEQVIDALAEKLGIDPIELRLRNIPAVSQLNDNQPYTSTGLAECLREGAKAFGWSAARSARRDEGHLRRGVGVAAGMWGYGGEPNATAIVTLYADGSVNLNTGASDLGTGTKTVLAMVVAEELGVPLDAHSGRARRHRDDEVLTVLRRQPDGARQLAGGARGGARGEAPTARDRRAAAREAGRGAFGAGRRRRRRRRGRGEGAVLRAEGSGPARDAGRPRHPPPPPGGQARPAVRGSIRRGRGGHPHRRGARRPLPRRPGLGEGDEPLHFRQPDVRRRLPGARVRPHRGARARPGRPARWSTPTGTTTRSRRCSTRRRRRRRCRSTRTTPSATPSGAKGLGEPAHIPSATAVANAIYNATGVRPLEAPVTPMRLLPLLAARERRA